MTPTLTSEERKRLAELEAKATPGPWQVRDVEHSGPWFTYVGEKRVNMPGFKVDGPLSLGNYELDALAETDAAFIAESRNLMPRLLARIEELEAERDQFRADVLRYAYHAGNCPAFFGKGTCKCDAGRVLERASRSAASSLAAAAAAGGEGSK